MSEVLGLHRKVDVRLLGKGNSNSHGARQIHLIIIMINWIRTSRLSMKNSLSVRMQVTGSRFYVSELRVRYQASSVRYQG